MDKNAFFETVVSPSSERLGIYGISHDVTFDKRHFVVTHKVSKNMLTQFDTRLSRYMAAVAGSGLALAAVETTIHDRDSGRSWQPNPVHHVASLPEALRTALQLALGSDQRVNARIGIWMSGEQDLEQERVVTEETVRALDQAIAISRQIGPPEFLEISGDLARLLLRPRGAQIEMLVMDIERGTISIPTTNELSGVAYQGPLFGFDRAVRQNQAVGTYLARARYAVTLAKEEAIYDFRAAAESRIMEFDGALGGRDLVGHRLASARSLVSRLQAGLGDTLLGLSEAAQLTALEWASEMRDASDMPSLGGTTDATDTPQRPQLVR